jgi:hypothetical protein
LALAILCLAATSLPAAANDFILVPMDLKQTNHLKAYGLAYHMLVQGQQVEWLLNYRGGSFLAKSQREMELEARVRGVSFEFVTNADVSAIKAEIERENMEVVLLEKPPRLAVYTPPNTQPWDDAVTLALTYAEIPFDKVYDREVLAGGLDKYDWLHLHHEDFTGQHGKFYAAYHTFPWYKEEEAVQQAKRVPAQHRLFRGGGFLACPFVAGRGDRVDRRVQALDARDGGLEQLDRRNLLGADAAAQLDGGFGKQRFVGRHFPSLTGTPSPFKYNSQVCQHIAYASFREGIK